MYPFMSLYIPTYMKVSHSLCVPDRSVTTLMCYVCVPVKDIELLPAAPE